MVDTSTDGNHDGLSGHIDMALHVGSLLIRATAYTALAMIADRYDFGHALCLGLLVGDVAASVARLVWQFRDEVVARAAELALLAIVCWVLSSRFTWPQEPAMRAILGLAAFGVFVSRTGGAMLTRIPHQ